MINEKWIFFWKRLPECLDTGLEHGITRSLISSPNNLTTTPLTAKPVIFQHLDIFMVAKQIGFHVGNEAGKSRSQRSKVLVQIQSIVTLFPFSVHHKSWDTVP